MRRTMITLTLMCVIFPGAAQTDPPPPADFDVSRALVLPSSVSVVPWAAAGAAMLGWKEQTSITATDVGARGGERYRELAAASVDLTLQDLMAFAAIVKIDVAAQPTSDPAEIAKLIAEHDSPVLLAATSPVATPDSIPKLLLVTGYHNGPARPYRFHQVIFECDRRAFEELDAGLIYRAFYFKKK